MARLEVVDNGVDVRCDAAQQVDQQPLGRPDGHRPALGRRHLVDDALWPGLLDRVQDVLGNVPKRLVPGHLFPVPVTTLANSAQRMKYTLLAVQRPAPGGALLTAHGVLIWDIVEQLRRTARHLLERDLPVLEEDVVHAAARVAVDAVSAPGDAVPRPALVVAVDGGTCALTGA